MATLGKELKIGDVVKVSELQTMRIDGIVKNSPLQVKDGFTMVWVTKQAPGFDDSEATTAVENNKNYNTVE